MKSIPFYRPSIEQAEIDEVVDTLKSGWLTTGPKTKQFEAEFAQYLQQKYAVAVNSCTAALHLALEAIGLRPNDTVIVPTMTFAATAEVVRYFGAKPLLVDCRPSDLNIDPADAERKIEEALQGRESDRDIAGALRRPNLRYRRHHTVGDEVPTASDRGRGALLPGLLSGR